MALVLHESQFSSHPGEYDTLHTEYKSLAVVQPRSRNMTIKANLSEFTIRIASPEQDEDYWRAIFVPWGRGKEWEAFKAAQHELKTLGDWANDGGHCRWVLVRRDDMDGKVYAGCETFRRKAFLKQKGEEVVQDVYAYGVASVVTPVEQHRNGFATHMLRLLHYYLSPPENLPPFPTAQWGPAPTSLNSEYRARLPPAICSFLTSDVGSKFYSRATIGLDRPGWVVRDEDSQQIGWKISAPSSNEADGSKKKFDWIYARDLPSISEELSTATRQRLSSEYKGISSSTWCFDPASSGTMSFIPYIAISEYEGDWKSNLESEPCGIRLPASEAGGEESIVLFAASTGSPVGKALLVTFVHKLDEERLPILLEALDVVGAQKGMEEAWVWGIDPSSALGKAWAGLKDRDVQSGRRVEWHGHLFGTAWYGSEEARVVMADTQMWNWC